MEPIEKFQNIFDPCFYGRKSSSIVYKIFYNHPMLMPKFHVTGKGILHLQLKFQVKIFIRSKVMMYTVMYGV